MRIARLLRPAAHVRGGVVSTELTVCCDGEWYRPDVGVVFGACPADGILDRASGLIVRLGGPLPATAWLAAGAAVVWSVDDRVVTQRSAAGAVTMARGAWLIHPDEPALRLPAAELLPPTAAADGRLRV